MFESIGLLACGLVIGFIIAIICYAISLATHKPDFDMDESEEFSGVINVKANNKAQHDVDTANRMRIDTESENDGA